MTRTCPSRTFFTAIAFGLLCCALATGCDSRRDLPDGRGFNVVLISIDTLRADHLGCYGYDARPTSPVLDGIAAEGIRFARAISQSPWTTPSHMTLMTSLYPSSHQLNQSFADWQKQARTLGAGHETLAQILSSHGYRTFAMVGGATVAGELGFRRGFDRYETGSAKLAYMPWKILRSWLSDSSNKPFLLFFHTFEVHAPYTSDRFAETVMSTEQRNGMREALAAARKAGGSGIGAQSRFLRLQGLHHAQVTEALYDGGVRAADEFVGRLLDELRRLGILEKTLLVVVSDHGEEFADHDRRHVYNAHGHSQYEEMVHVPLILRYPGFGRPGLVVEAPVGLIDVGPTILEILGLPPRTAMQGQSLMPLLHGESVGRNWVLSEASTGAKHEVKGLRTRSFSLLSSYAVGRDRDRSRIPGRRMRALLFDLRSDPRQQRDIGNDRAELLERMLATLERRFAELPVSTPATAVSMDERLESELRALGYL